MAAKEGEAVQKIAVLGGGSFGTVIANMLADKGHHVFHWMRDSLRVSEINELHENRRYLPGVTLSERVFATVDLAEAVKDAGLIFVSIPSHSFREVAKALAKHAQAGQFVISTTKGIEAGTFSLMSQILADECPNLVCGVLSGPNLAKEIANRQLTATVIASTDAELRERVQKALHNNYFRVYASPDVYGVELGGTLKNIYAIAAGLSAAMGVGENTRSMLVTRSLAEMSRFAVSMGANPMTFIGLAGVGDLIVTCMSPLSRNYRIGYELGSGTSLEDAIEKLGQVAEGVNTLKHVKARAEELNIYMPLVWGLYEVVFNKAPVAAVIKTLMSNEQSTDVEFVLPRTDK